MSVAQARGIISGLKWYHLGFCLFWAVTFVALVEPAETYKQLFSLYSIGRQFVTLATVVALAMLSSRMPPSYDPRLAPATGVALSAGTLLYYLAFFFGAFSYISLVVSAVLVGAAQGAFFVMWQSFYASEGTSRTTIYIPLSALCSVGLCLIISALPFGWLVVCAVVVFPAAAGETLRISLKEVVPYETKPLRSEARKFAADMTLSVLCVCVLAFVWRIVSCLAGSAAASSSLSIMFGMSCATLLLSLIELFSEKGFNILRVYPVIFPVVTVVFLLPVTVGALGYVGLSACTMFGFEVLNLLLLSACAAYASQNALNSTQVYALCMGPMLFVLAMGDVVGNVATDAILVGFIPSLNVAVLVFSIVALVVLLVPGAHKAALRKMQKMSAKEQGGAQSGGALQEAQAAAGGAVQGAAHQEAEAGLPSKGDQPAEGNASLCADDERPFAIEDAAAAMRSWESKLEQLKLPEPLSAREREVVDLVLRGNTAAAIARKLFISENTVRGHMKSIYRKLGIHSKQELIDLLG